MSRKLNLIMTRNDSHKCNDCVSYNTRKKNRFEHFLNIARNSSITTNCIRPFDLAAKISLVSIVCSLNKFASVMTMNQGNFGECALHSGCIVCVNLIDFLCFLHSTVHKCYLYSLTIDATKLMMAHTL